MLQRLIDTFQLDQYELLCVYMYGSRVYGTHDENSDHDFIVVVKDDVGCIDGISGEWADITIYDQSTFQKRVNEHEISVLECLSLDSEKILLEKWRADFKLIPATLRAAVSSKSSNSFVKAKKKMTIPESFNIKIAKKSLFSSIRIINFGLQISSYGCVRDFTGANNFWRDINKNPSTDWEEYKKQYKPIHNQMMTEFRKSAPKEFENS